MSQAKELQAPIEQLLHALYRREAATISKLAAAFSKEARRHRVIQAKGAAAVAATEYLLGAWEVLEALAIRANARQAQNAQVSVAKLRYGLDVLALLAHRRGHAVSPGALTEGLRKQHEEGVHGNNVSRLIARLKAADLVAAHEGGTGDARTKPIQITESGWDVLEGLRPGWRAYVRSRIGEPVQPTEHIGAPRDKSLPVARVVPLAASSKKLGGTKSARKHKQTPRTARSVGKAMKLSAARSD
ncbi:hypothetical protein ACFPN2_15730 [Steroidobacter flavus]|uniref:MarR family transcriptional regulator n=1 Tax=Steroidobacter flavus TaxID=1842136 RepID=A0ABV8SSR9_9GAMM